jgi:hypothetical protein
MVIAACGTTERATTVRPLGSLRVTSTDRSRTVTSAPTTAIRAVVPAGVVLQVALDPVRVSTLPVASITVIGVALLATYLFS